MNFLESFLASISAGIILIMLAGFFSKRVRWVFTATIGRILDIDTEYVFRNPREASEDITKELGIASCVRLFTSRGNELQRETFAQALNRTKGGTLPDFRILLPLTTLNAGEYDWIAQRESELAVFDSAYGQGLLRNQIETNKSFLASHLSAGCIEVKFYNSPHIGRILLTDRAAYFTPYRKDAHGRDCRVIKYRRGGDMYELFNRFFDQLWNAI